ncbi:MAG TPA: histidinol-phosphate transaminase [Burkholderiales bacterium]|nr:histidinol-phosphate transaminase [Burkholderiales bacterium]
MINILAKANSAVLQTIPYQAGKPIEEVKRELGITDIIKLASNENPLGSSPKAIRAVMDIVNEAHIYPDASYYNLRLAIAEYNGVDIKSITVGNGSENCIEFLIKAFLNSKSNVIVDQYCFATIQILIKSYGAEIIKIKSINYRQNIEETINRVNSDTKMIFVVNPNNPTGTYTTHEELVYLLENIPSDILVVVDEAYYEYVDKVDYPKTLDLIKIFPNLIISRSFSKVFGLAGLRLGYLISSIEIADLLNRSRLPFNVNITAAVAGIAALSDYEFLEITKKINKDGLMQLEKGLEQYGIEYIPSVANFITIDAKSDGVNVFNKLLQKGIIVRPLVPYDLPKHLRVTIGTFLQNERFLTVIKDILV